MDEPLLTKIVLPQNGDITLRLAITDPTLPLVQGLPQPFDLTNKTVTFWRKASRFVPDTDPSAKSYSCSVQGPATAGICTVAIPGTDNTTPGTTWWRVDVTSGAARMPMNYGPLEVYSV
jgi:hypothetical protein